MLMRNRASIHYHKISRRLDSEFAAEMPVEFQGDMTIITTNKTYNSLVTGGPEIIRKMYCGEKDR